MKPPFLTPVEEHDLVILAQAGDLVARDKVMAGIMPIIFGKAIGIANKNPPADPDDLTQEAVMQILTKFGMFDASRGVRVITYFDSLITRTMVRLIKQNGVIRAVGSPPSIMPLTQAARVKHAGQLASLNVSAGAGEEDGDLIDLLADERDAPAEHERRQALVLAVRGCIERIPERWRQLIRWRFIDGLRHAEIAVKMRRTQAAVQQMQAEAMRWVRRILLTSPAVGEFVEDLPDEKQPAWVREPKRPRKVK